MLVSSVGVFYNSDTILHHIATLPTVKNACTMYNSLAEFAAATHCRKIAIIHAFYKGYCGFDNSDLTIQDQVDTLLNDIYCDQIIILFTELHQAAVPFAKKYDNKKISFYLCGDFNFKLQFSTVKQYMNWFESSVYFYKTYLPELLSRLQPFDSKPRNFDILLGRKKEHRDFVYKSAMAMYDDTRPNTQNIITYFDSTQGHCADDTTQWVWEKVGLLQPNYVITNTIDTVSYFGHPIYLSQIIPIDIYNNTNYSVVAETNCSNKYSFFTEKTVKPILARRLFVMFAGQHYLQNLRNMGFKTFDTVIDESYDNEVDDSTRWGMAWNQIVWLSDQDPVKILEMIKPIVNHNFDIMINTAWHQDFATQLEQDIARTIAG